jgi:hypothetical protein
LSGALLSLPDGWKDLPGNQGKRPEADAGLVKDKESATIQVILKPGQFLQKERGQQVGCRQVRPADQNDRGCLGPQVSQQRPEIRILGKENPLFASSQVEENLIRSCLETKAFSMKHIPTTQGMHEAGRQVVIDE